MKINEMQKEIYQNKLNKGFNVTDVHEEFCLLYGEVAEAYDAWRKNKTTVGKRLQKMDNWQLVGIIFIAGTRN